MALPNIKIELDEPGQGHIFLNGEEMPYVKGFTVKGKVNEMTKCELTLSCGVLDCYSVLVTEIPMSVEYMGKTYDLVERDRK